MHLQYRDKLLLKFNKFRLQEFQVVRQSLRIRAFSKFISQSRFKVVVARSMSQGPCSRGHRAVVIIGASALVYKGKLLRRE